MSSFMITLGNISVETIVTHFHYALHLSGSIILMEGDVAISDSFKMGVVYNSSKRTFGLGKGHVIFSCSLDMSELISGFA